MKAQPLRLVFNVYEKCEPMDATHLFLRFPGPLPDRTIPVMIGGTRAGTPNWTWNGDCEKPTLKPSVLTGGVNKDGVVTCHSWVNDGVVHFLADCSHELAGKSVSLLDVDVCLDDGSSDEGWSHADEDSLEETERRSR